MIAAVVAAISAVATGCVAAPPVGADDSPSGHVDTAHALPDGRARVSGWALDRNSDDPIQVAAMVRGEWVEVAEANWSRPDVEAAHDVGSHHGFQLLVDDVQPGEQVCIAGLNVGPGVNSAIGCVTVSDPPSVDFVDCWASPRPGVNYSGCFLDSRNFEYADLRNANLRGTYLGTANLYRANLAGADLTGADLSRTTLMYANLTGVNLTGANLTEVQVLDLSLDGAIADRATFDRTLMNGLSLKGFAARDARFTRSGLVDLDLRDSNLRGVTIAWSNLSGSQLPSSGIGFENSTWVDVKCPDGRSSTVVQRCGIGPGKP